MDQDRNNEESGEDEARRERLIQRSTCPVCLLNPCSETCPIGFTEEEAKSLTARFFDQHNPLE